MTYHDAMPAGYLGEEWPAARLVSPERMAPVSPGPPALPEMEIPSEPQLAPDEVEYLGDMPVTVGQLFPPGLPGWVLPAAIGAGVGAVLATIIASRR